MECLNAVTGAHVVRVCLPPQDALLVSDLLVSEGHVAVVDGAGRSSSLACSAWVAESGDGRGVDWDLPGLLVVQPLRSGSTPSQSGVEPAYGSGVVDFIWRPLSPDELRFRLRRVLARPRREHSGVFQREILSHGPLTVDVAARELRVNGTAVTVRRAELETLLVLMRSPHRCFAARELERVALGHVGNGSAARNHIYELRRKLSGAGAPEVVVSDRNRGYRVAPMAAAQGSARPEHGHCPS